jgi:hypothetical protein
MVDQLSLPEQSTFTELQKGILKKSHTLFDKILGEYDPNKPDLSIVPNHSKYDISMQYEFFMYRQIDPNTILGVLIHKIGILMKRKIRTVHLQL